MTDNVIQFIPKPNPSRLTLLETEAVKEAMAAPEHAVVPTAWVDEVLMQQDDFRQRYLAAHPEIDTSPSEYVADSGDCA